MFRVFVHVYIHHFDRMTALQAEAHGNTLFKHYYYFVKEFNLGSILQSFLLAENSCDKFLSSSSNFEIIST
jgi:hypothetical protein